jgi:hypothetical protein
MDDWRLNGQERYLSGVTLVRRTYRRYSKNAEWDHDHCEFCFAKFMIEDVPDVLHVGYSTEDEYRWICDSCFAEFKDRFRWTVTRDETS